MNQDTIDQQLWTAVDRYIGEALVPSDPALDAALAASDRAGLPAINVAPNQGRFLALLATLCGARRILEIGTLGGYSAIWLARTLPAGGRLITLEADPKHAKVAHANIQAAGLGERVEVRLGRALDLLPVLEAERQEPFDFVFIDADKVSNAAYFEWAVKLARPGTVIVVDNVVRKGKVIDPNTGDAAVDGVRRLNETIARIARVSATTIQTVGSKGYDGFTLAVVDAPRDGRPGRNEA